jgi:DNA-binding transcriptional LysR family regulator
MDRLDELSVFLAVLDAGSLSGAARRLRRSAPAVTRAVASLEARAGVRLIERTTRRMALTEAGRRMAEDARELIAWYEAAMDWPDTGPLRGLIRITAPLVFGRRHVAPLLTQFLADHPQVSGDLVLSNSYLDLIEERFDVALRFGALSDSSLVARRVGAVRWLVVASPDYLARHGAPEQLRDLARHQIGHTSPQPGPMEWRFGGPRDGQTVRVQPRLVVNASEPLIAAALAGECVTRVVSYQVAEEIADGRLVRLLRAFEPPPMPVQIVTTGARLAPARVRAFVDAAVAAFSRLDLLGPP